MHKFLLFAAAAVISAAALAQTPPAPAAAPVAPAADPDLVEPDPETPKSRGQLLETGSFERPRVTARTAGSDGGSPVRTAKREWTRFVLPKIPEGGGRLSAGLTNEIARTGRQSLFVEFDKVTASQASATLASELISIQPAKEYRVAIWGRLHRKTPLTVSQRIPFLRLQVDFFAADRDTQVGEAIYRIQPMPGSKNRPPLFTTGKWNAFFAEVESPEDAAYIRITWNWGTPLEKGTTSGVIFFDDATIEGPPGKTEEEIMAETPEPTEEPAADDTAAPAPPAVQPAPMPENPPPAATPAPAPKSTPKKKR